MVQLRSGRRSQSRSNEADSQTNGRIFHTMSKSQLIRILPFLYTAGCNLGTALCVWDTLLVFDEIQFIWSSEFACVKILYLLVRYLVLAIYCMMVFAYLGSPTDSDTIQYTVSRTNINVDD